MNEFIFLTTVNLFTFVVILKFECLINKKIKKNVRILKFVWWLQDFSPFGHFFDYEKHYFPAGNFYHSFFFLWFSDFVIKTDKRFPLPIVQLSFLDDLDTAQGNKTGQKVGTITYSKHLKPFQRSLDRFYFSSGDSPLTR